MDKIKNHQEQPGANVISWLIEELFPILGVHFRIYPPNKRRKHWQVGIGVNSNVRINLK